jgi:probable F420-dependent oxidoreductase
MDIGLVLPQSHRWCNGNALRAIGRLADERGFHSIWAGDHLVAPLGPPEKTRVVRSQYQWMLAPGKPPPGPHTSTAQSFYGKENWFPEIYTTLSFLAGVTQRVRIGASLVVVPYRNPVVQARMVATLDQFSGGRLMLGVGAGHVESEAAAVSAAWTERGAATEEAIALMKRMWAGERASFHGEHFHLEEVLTLGQPLQRPHPPLFYGGMAKPAIARAVRSCQGWLPTGSWLSPEELAAGVAFARAEAERIGRSEPLQFAMCFETRLETGYAEPAAHQWGESYEPPKKRTAREVIDTLKNYEAIGFGTAALMIDSPSEDDYLRQISAVAEGVLPAFH